MALYMVENVLEVLLQSILSVVLGEAMYKEDCHFRTQYKVTQVKTRRTYFQREVLLWHSNVGSWVCCGKPSASGTRSWKIHLMQELGLEEVTSSNSLTLMKYHTVGIQHKINCPIEDSHLGDSFALKETGDRTWRQNGEKERKTSSPPVSFHHPLLIRLT